MRKPLLIHIELYLDMRDEQMLTVNRGIVPAVTSSLGCVHSSHLKNVPFF